MTAEQFLRAHGYAAATAQNLPGDASHRAYARLAGGPAPALLMTTTTEDAATFARIAGALAVAGLAAPTILAADPAHGRLLVADLGAETLADRLDAGADPVPLYAAAGATLAALHAAPPPPGLPLWDAPAMAAATAATLLDWWWPAAFGRPPDAPTRAALADALHAMLAPFAAGTWVHRDYFPPNLIPPEPNAKTCALLDFQDAAIGHPAYDLVSLIEDARRDVPPAARHAALAAYAATRPAPDPAALAALGAQRHLRVAGLWVRLARRDARPGYLRHGPRTWTHLAASLAHPATAPLQDFLDRHVPCDMRRNPALAASRPGTRTAASTALGAAPA